MTASAHSPTIHACAVLVGAGAVLIRGPSGAGKSRLAYALLGAAQTGGLRFARLVSDDRTHLAAVHGRLLASPPAALAGLLEMRGLGVRRLEHEAPAVVTLVVDLAAPDADRVPTTASRQVEIQGISLPRLAIAVGEDPLAVVLAALTTRDALA